MIKGMLLGAFIALLAVGGGLAWHKVEIEGQPQPVPAACEAALDEADEIYGLLASNDDEEITPAAILAFYRWKDQCLGE